LEIEEKKKKKVGGSKKRLKVTHLIPAQCRYFSPGEERKEAR